MYRVLLVFIFTLVLLSAKAQKTAYTNTVDTIQVFEDKLFVHFKSFKDSVEFEDCYALLFPVKLKVPRFRMFPNFLRKEVEADSVVYHGYRTVYAANRHYVFETYNMGELLSTKFYSADGVEISESEFPEFVDRNTRCGNSSTRYFIYGKKI